MKRILKGCLGCLGLLFGISLIAYLGLYVYYEWIWQEWSPARIERITGIRVPSYNVTEYHEGSRLFPGDYDDTYEIEFKEMPSEELFDEIDKLISTGKTSWRKKGNEYSFPAFWGNGMPAPKGEDENDDRTFCITLTRGEKRGVITSGVW